MQAKSWKISSPDFSSLGLHRSRKLCKSCLGLQKSLDHIIDETWSQMARAWWTLINNERMLYVNLNTVCLIWYRKSSKMPTQGDNFLASWWGALIRRGTRRNGVAALRVRLPIKALPIHSILEQGVHSHRLRSTFQVFHPSGVDKLVPASAGSQRFLRLQVLRYWLGCRRRRLWVNHHRLHHLQPATGQSVKRDLHIRTWK